MAVWVLQEIWLSLGEQVRDNEALLPVLASRVLQGSMAPLTEACLSEPLLGRLQIHKKEKV